MSKDIIELRRFSKNAAEFADKVDKSFDFNLPRDGDPTGSTGVWDEEIRAFADSQTLKSLFFSEDWVYILVDLCANKLSSVPLNVVRKEPNTDGTLTTEPVHDHGLMPLILMPNPWQEYPSWMYNYCVEDFLLGNTVNWFAERNGHLIILPGDQVTAQFNNKGQLDTYKLHVRTAEQSFLAGAGQRSADQALTFPADQIIHTRRPNPASLLWGLSPFTPGRKPVLFNRYSSDYLNSFYLKQATPAMAITMDRTVNEELALRQLASFEMAYTGRRNARRTLMLPKGTDAKPMTHTIAEQGLIDIIEKNRETIINLLKVPKHELGLQESGSLGSEEHKIALRNFWEATLIPASKRIQGGLTQFFRRKDMLAEDEFLEFDLSGVDALKDDLKKKAEIAKEMAQTLPLNTVIQKVWEEEPLDTPKADLPLSMQPKAGVSVSTEVDRTEENEPSPPEETEEEKLIRADSQFALEYSERHASRMEKLEKSLDDIVNDQGSQIEERTLDLFVDMAEKAIRVIQEALVDTPSDDVGPEKNLPPDLHLSRKAKIKDEARLRRSLEREFDDFEDEYVKDFDDVLLPAVELSYDNFLEVGFNQEDRAQIEALKVRDKKRRKAILTARGFDSFSKISKTQSHQIVDEVKRGIEAQESIGDIVQRVANTFKDPEKSIGRARTIARTEALTASSIGQQAAFLNADEVIPGIERAWINIGDLRVRGRPDGKYPKAKDDHWKLQGQRRKKGKKFSNGLEYPRDVKSNDPAKVINCRCTLVLIPPGEKIGDL